MFKNLSLINLVLLLCSFAMMAEAVPVTLYNLGTANSFLIVLLVWLVTIVWIGAQWIDAVIIDGTGYTMSATMIQVVQEMKDAGGMMGGLFYGMANWWIVIFFVQLIGQTVLVIALAFFVTAPFTTNNGANQLGVGGLAGVGFATWFVWIVGLQYGVIGLMKVRHVFFAKTMFYFVPAIIALIEFVIWITAAILIAMDMSDQPANFDDKWRWWFLLFVDILWVLVALLLAVWHIGFAWYGRGVTPQSNVYMGEGNQGVNVVSTVSHAGKNTKQSN